MNKTYPTLYKKTVTGAIQTWYMIQEGDSFCSVSGQIDGKKVQSDFTECYGKNIGKKNETSAVEQATLEIEAQYKKKLSQGNYKESIELINDDNYFKPMLANKYKDHPVDDVQCQKGNVYSQPKLDGVRCIVDKHGMWSRQGKPFVSAPHIFQALKPVFDKHPDAIFDGELYNHSLKDDFNTIISLCKQTKPTQSDLDASKKTIQYHIYDFPYQAMFSHRLALLKQIETDFWLPDCIRLVRTDKVKSVDNLDQLYAEYIEQGYEGQMVRIDRSAYENKRTNQLLKRKEFLDEEFEIVDIEEGKGNRSGMAGRIVYKLSDGRTFESGIRGTFDYCKTLLEESKHYIGGEGTVRFFNWTPDGKPRFPVTTALYKQKRAI